VDGTPSTDVLPAGDGQPADDGQPPTGDQSLTSDQSPVESTPAPEAAPEAVKLVTTPRKRVRKAKVPKARQSNDEKLSLARMELEAGRYDEAAEHYAGLIAAGKKLDTVLADLDAVTHAHPDVRRFHALLGDVYTRKGDVNAALMAYHRALESH
jgi:hypothetical protein